MTTKDSTKTTAAKTNIAITVDGETFVLDPKNITAADAMIYRSTTGHSFKSALQALATDPDLDVIVGMFWLAQRQAGKKSLMLDVMKAVTYDSKFEVDFTSEDAGNPEA